MMWEDNWIMDSYFGQKQMFLNLRRLNDGFVSSKHSFSLHGIINWSGVAYLWIIVMFLSAVWAHSDGTHSLQRMIFGY